MLVLGACLALGACDKPREQFQDIDITGADFARDFKLTDTTGKQRTLADYRGRVVVLFFGYTQCPDFCPTTMSDLATVMNELGADAARVQVLFVTLDPARDTPKVLSAYVPGFDPRFMGLYGTEQETADAAREFKVFYQKVDGPTPTSYSLDHTAQSYVFDTKGKVRLVIPNAQKPAAIEHDIKLLLGS
jgi:protein SCO1/2